MADSEGTPIWYELMTTDSDSAQKFYADVVGWNIAPSGMAGVGDYSILGAPAGQHIVMGTDPQGAAFALVGGN